MGSRRGLTDPASKHRRCCRDVDGTIRDKIGHHPPHFHWPPALDLSTQAFCLPYCPAYLNWLHGLCFSSRASACALKQSQDSQVVPAATVSVKLHPLGPLGRGEKGDKAGHRHRTCTSARPNQGALGGAMNSGRCVLWTFSRRGPIRISPPSHRHGQIRRRMMQASIIRTGCQSTPQSKSITSCANFREHPCRGGQAATLASAHTQFCM
jgi:hypothetical protein